MESIYVNLKSPIERASSESLDELKISVDYQKGGYNYFSGNYSEGGVYAYLTPVYRTCGVISCTMLGKQHECGYKIFLKALGRKSQKQIDLMFNKIMPHAQEIADLYSDYKHQEVYELIKSLIG